jgi:hypothetical protein
MVTGPNCMVDAPAPSSLWSKAVLDSVGDIRMGIIMDTHHVHCGVLSLFVNTKILEGVTIVLCIEDNVSVLKHQLVGYL